VIGINERIGTYVKRLHAALARLKSWYNVLGAPDLKYVDVDAKSSRRLLHLANLKHGRGITDIRDDRDAAEIG
jgi:hypothetical protein